MLTNSDPKKERFSYIMDLLIIVGFSLLLAPLVLFSSGATRVIIGLAFILFSPGYTFIAALFPKKTSFGNFARISLSFGLSVVVVPLIGLLLHYTWAINTNSIIISILIFVLIMVVIAVYRRRMILPQERYQPRLHSSILALYKSWAIRDSWDRILSIILLVAITASIGSLIYTIASTKTAENYTEFYLLGNNEQADGYPIEFIVENDQIISVNYYQNGEYVKISESLGSIVLSIVNREHTETTYQVELMIGGEQVNIYLDGEGWVGDVGPIYLSHEEKWKKQISFAPRHTGTSQKVEFLLFRNGELYFDDPIHIWIDVVNQ